MSSTTSAPLPSVLLVFLELFGRKFFKQWIKHSAATAVATRSKSSNASKGRTCPHPPARFYERIFSLPVTLWYLIFQRLNADKTQDAVIKDLRRGGADRLSPSAKRPLSKKIRSKKTASYNEARQRTPLDFLKFALRRIGEHLQGHSGPNGAVTQGRTFQLIDGSTLPVLRNKAIAKDYPPARNQSGESDWCLMRVVVGFCACTGVVLSAVEATTLKGEQALAWSLMEAAAKATVWIGDRNFGVWSVVAKALFHHQDVIVRLTQAQAARLAGGRTWVSGQDKVAEWRRTRRNQVAPGTGDIKVKGRVIFVRLRREGKYISLWLFTTLMDTEAFSIERLVQLYGLRWQAELNFRHLKTSLEMEQLFVVSPEMARKEFYAGLIAYSLVRVVMAACPPPQPNCPGLSFSQVRRVLVHWLLDWGRDWRSRKGSGQKKLALLVAEAAQELLPTRKRPRRSEPRQVRHRRLKFPPLIGSRKAARKKAKNAKTQPKSW
jgi:Transposase DDE domain